MYLLKKSGNIQVVDLHVPLGVGLRDKSGLRLYEKWGASDEPLSF